MVLNLLCPALPRYQQRWYHYDSLGYNWSEIHALKYTRTIVENSRKDAQVSVDVLTVFLFKIKYFRFQFKILLIKLFLLVLN